MKRLLISLITLFCALVSQVLWANSAQTAFVDLQLKVLTDHSAEPSRIIAAMVPVSGERNSPVSKKIAQSNALFKPFITIAQTGAEIVFPNLDDFAHHVYSFSKTMPFELPLYSKGEQQEIQLSAPGILSIGCNIHDWMFAYIVVVDTSYATFLDEDYIAQFSRIPVGDYQLLLWHPSMNDFWKTPVSVSANDALLAITLPAKLSSVTPPIAPDRSEWERDY